MFKQWNKCPDCGNEFRCKVTRSYKLEIGGYIFIFGLVASMYLLYITVGLLT